MTVKGDPLAVDSHFGTVDGRFLGISLNINSRRHGRLVQALLSGDDPSRIFLRDNQGSFGFEEITQFTALSHEIQHFFDLMISPWGAEIFLWRIDALLHMNKFIQVLMHHPSWKTANAIPVPLLKWCGMEAGRRSSYLHPIEKALNDLHGSQLRVPELPYIKFGRGYSNDDVVAVTTAGSREAAVLLGARLMAAYRRLDDLLRFHPPPGVTENLQPSHVAEAAAFARQTMEVGALFGEERALEFLNALRSQHPNSVLGLDIVLSCFMQAGIEPTIGRALTMLTWSLLGNVTGTLVDIENCVYRLSQVVMDVIRFGWLDGLSSAERFELWDERLHHPSTLDGVSQSLREDGDYIRSLEANANFNDLSDDPVGRGLVTSDVVVLLKEKLEYRKLLVERFLEDPDAYILGGAEFTEGAPFPPVRIIAKPGLVQMPIDDDQYWVHQWLTDRNGNQLGITSVAYDIMGGSPVTAKDACRFYDELTLTDIIFSSFDRNFSEHDLRVARDWMGNLRLINVIDNVPDYRRDGPPERGAIFVPTARLWVPKRP